MENKSIQINFKGIDKLQQLLRETLDLTEQLQNNLDEISNCELDVSAKLINQVKSELDDYFNSLLDV